MKKLTGHNKLLILKSLLILVIGIVSGVCLLIGVFCIPTEKIYENVKDSTYIFDIEGTYPVINNQPGKMLDNYTDALMLGAAAYKKEGAGVPERAMAAYHPEIDGLSPDRSLSLYMSGDADHMAVSYERYWHGYLVVLKPLLLFSNYLDIRGMNRVIQICLAILTVFIFYRKNVKRMILPFLLTYLFLRPDALALSMQYSDIYYISIIGLINILLFQKKIERYKCCPYVFLIIGMCTSYFDFLTYPLVTLGLPLTVVVVLQNKDTWINSTKAVIGYSIMWGIGYIGMWSGKWLAGSIFLGKNLFEDAINMVKFRSSLEYNGKEFSYLQVVSENFDVGFDKIWGFCFIAAAVILFLGIYMARKDIRKALLNLIPFVLIIIMPFCWYVLAANHSFLHSGFAYRELAIVVFAFFSMCSQLVLNKEYKSDHKLEIG